MTTVARVSFTAGVLALGAVAAAVQPAPAITTQSVRTIPYVAAYEPHFGATGVPSSGNVVLRFNHGLISGTYQSTSIRPDPLSGRTLAVNGGTDGRQIHFTIGTALTFNGTISPDSSTIRGTATGSGGRIFDFYAKRGRPGSGR